jgi:hypothetical protein
MKEVQSLDEVARMLRLALASVLLLSIGAVSQTAPQVDHARPEADQAATSAAATISPDLPEAPSAIERALKSTDSAPGFVAPDLVAPDLVAPDLVAPDLGGTRFVSPAAGERNKGSAPRTLDRKFILLQTLSAAALVADVETTMRDLGGQRASELNPLFGQHPTRARLYGINVPLNVLSFYVSYHFKKTDPSRSLWKVGPALSLAVHATATINNLIVAH